MTQLTEKQKLIFEFVKTSPKKIKQITDFCANKQPFTGEYVSLTATQTIKELIKLKLIVKNGEFYGLPTVQKEQKNIF